MSPNGTKRTCRDDPLLVRSQCEADMSRPQVAYPSDAINPKRTSHSALVALASAKSQTNTLEPDTLEFRCPRLTCFHRQCASQGSARHDFTSRERQIVRIARKQLDQMTYR